MKTTCIECKQTIKIGLILFMLVVGLETKAQFFVNTESGVLFTEFNEIKNGRNGNLISLNKDLSTPVGPFFRFRFGYLHNNKNHVSLLYAPLNITATGVLNRLIFYDGKAYEANLPLEAQYKFNSYRLTFNRRVIDSNSWNLGFGFSAKIRDAGTSLKSEKEFSENFSIGFVPLVNVIANWQASKKVGISLFGEGIVASKGRALDVSLSGVYDFSKNWQGALGYRLLDGGASGANQYNFIRLHFATISLNYSL